MGWCCEYQRGGVLLQREQGHSTHADPPSCGRIGPSILVNAIAPGPFESRLTAKLMAAREAVE
jgi:hypothetical protein